MSVDGEPEGVMKLTAAKKRLIAVWQTYAAICQEHAISAAALYRLKREDTVFLAAVDEPKKPTRISAAS